MEDWNCVALNLPPRLSAHAPNLRLLLALVYTELCVVFSGNILHIYTWFRIPADRCKGKAKVVPVFDHALKAHAGLEVCFHPF